MISAEPDGASLVDQEQVDIWVAHWGQWLAELGDEPGIVAASVTVETRAGHRHRLRREVQQHDGRAPASSPRRCCREVVQTYPAGSATGRGPWSR